MGLARKISRVFVRLFGDSDIYWIIRGMPYFRVRFKQNLSDPYVLFDPSTLGNLLGCKNYGELPSRAAEYLASHPWIERMPERPQSFMVAEPERRRIGMIHPHYLFADKGEYTVCKDINLLLQVFGATVGRLYIPDRKLEYSENCFSKLLLRAREVYGHD